MADFSTPLGALTLRNPLMAASGCFGYGVEYAGALDLASLGAVVVKGLFLSEREGHAPPRIVETPAGMLNAIGLQGIGVHRFVKERLPELRALGAVTIVNVCGVTLDEYCEVSRVLSDHEGVAAIELPRHSHAAPRIALPLDQREARPVWAVLTVDPRRSDRRRLWRRPLRRAAAERARCRDQPRHRSDEARQGMAGQNARCVRDSR